jgi:phosphopantothenoylcysteine decarboxylase/phosphopantothenate--cysteine ligase
VPVPGFVRHVPVESTADMAAAVADALPAADATIMAAAPADFRPAQVASAKIKRAGAVLALPLEPTPDILASTRDRRRPGAVLVGFALETNDGEANARAKLAAKALDLIVLNDATESGAGFGVDTNRVTLLGADGSREALALLPKGEVADAILDRVERLLAERGGSNGRANGARA